MASWNSVEKEKENEYVYEYRKNFVRDFIRDCTGILCLYLPYHAHHGHSGPQRNVDYGHRIIFKGKNDYMLE
jgi:hypothetical protein